MSENGKDKIKGIRIRTVSYTMIFLSIVLYLVLLYTTRQVSKEYEVVVAATDDYIMCDAQAAQLAQGSDYLTEQIQLYVVTGKPEYVHNYFEEVNVAKRREHALKELEQYNVHPEAHRFLEEALARSNQYNGAGNLCHKINGIGSRYGFAGVPGNYPKNGSEA